MTPLFADTSFFVAFLSLRDRHHQQAEKYFADPNAQFVTTQWVLAELGMWGSHFTNAVQTNPGL